MGKTVLALCVAVLATLGLDAQARQSMPTFRSAIDVVPIRAVVRDQHGRMVEGLKAADFQVLDGGRASRIVDFQNDHDSPITIAVLVDTSGSMSMGQKIAYAANTIEHLAAALDDQRDEAALFTFDATLREQQPFSGRAGAMASAIGQARPWGTTSLYDAIGETARKVAERRALRRALVVLTDGLDNGSTRTAAEISGLASSLDVPVYIVATVPPIDRQRQLERNTVPQAGSATMRELAEWTGGNLLWVTSPEEAMLRTRALISELRQQYVIAIESAPGAEWRPLEIRTRNQRLTVRARSGYFGRTGTASSRGQ